MKLLETLTEKGIVTQNMRGYIYSDCAAVDNTGSNDLVHF